MLWDHPLQSKELTETVKGLTTMIDAKFARLRTYRNNIHRYRRLLKTELSDLERQFIERRLEEDRSAMQMLASSTFPLTFKKRRQQILHQAAANLREQFVELLWLRERVRRSETLDLGRLLAEFEAHQEQKTTKARRLMH